MKRRREERIELGFENLYNYLTERIKGQEKALRELSTVLTRNQNDRIQGFFLAGPTGTGKSFTANHFLKFLPKEIESYTMIIYPNQMCHFFLVNAFYSELVKHMKASYIIIFFENVHLAKSAFYFEVKPTLERFIAENLGNETRFLVFFIGQYGSLDVSNHSKFSIAEEVIRLNPSNCELLTIPLIYYPPLSLSTHRTILLELSEPFVALSEKAKIQYIERFFNQCESFPDLKHAKAQLLPQIRLIDELWPYWLLLKTLLFDINDLSMLILHFYLSFNPMNSLCLIGSVPDILT